MICILLKNDKQHKSSKDLEARMKSIACNPQWYQGVFMRRTLNKTDARWVSYIRKIIIIELISSGIISI